ncbi:RND superfamily putative drug exporter [Diaminobutyricimonas aerilata]|uniref:RND superfamily putative drug exporter n=1 Tax=Diaminobutyricimonas aerilata TaxID=1162967 RepID=A0A2M9CHE7_9MICO|nr:MMPL family transporter [Diaminobutyricimonas aerilata]PJJ71299.1 RND superfamily putative drug exporter [Diaminobutyricimonas aerilata]
MATLLYRLGRFSYRRPWPVIVAWILLMAAILGGGLALGGKTQESFVIPGTESQDAIDRLAAVFPQTAGASAQIVVQAPDGDELDSEPYRDEVVELAERIGDVDGVAQAIDPFSEYASEALSDSGTTGIVQVQFDESAQDVTDSTLEGVREAAQPALDADLRVEFGGSVYEDLEYGITPTEIVGVLFAAVVLLITFGSLLAAGMPLLTAITAVGVTMGGITAVSAFTTISSATPLLAVMIGLAVGIDYALFILSRHRTQLAAGMDAEESAATSVATAGSSVVFAGVTVIIALLGLLVVGIPFLSAMGVSAAGAVLLAILVSITMLPAFLGLAKDRLRPKEGSRAHRRAAVVDGKPTFGERWVKLVLKAPIVAVVLVIGVLGTLAIPAFQLNLALPDGGSQPEGSTAREAYDLVSDEFGPGRNGPLIVAVDITQTTDFMDDLETIADRVERLDGVQYVGSGTPNPTLDTAILQVIPETEPDSPATTELVREIRDLAPDIERDLDTPIFVTGTTAVMIDISTRLDEALVPFGVIVVGLSIVLLMMVFRSLLVPLKAALGFLLSVFASFGVVVAVFQWGWGAELLHAVPGPILSFMPILLMAVLFGLAMDYEVFLVSGMREEFVHGGDARHAIVRGFRGAARVVTAAALIMFFVFAAFVPEGAGVIKVIALGLAVGIAFDAFLVRMTLVPAIMALAGRAAWYLPKWLDRVLPNVDIEGESLRHHRAAARWADGEGEWAISAEHLVAGNEHDHLESFDVRVPKGALVLASGPARVRRLVAATLAGRIPAKSGQAQVLGHSVTAEQGRVAALVALGELGAPRHGELRPTVGELLAERVRMTRPWYRSGRADPAVESWVSRINDALGPLARVYVRSDDAVDQLPQLERAVALAAVALTERAPVVMLDQLDAFAAPDDADAFLRAVSVLAPAATTIVIGTPVPARALSAPPGRETISLDLYDLDRSEALR